MVLKLSVEKSNMKILQRFFCFPQWKIALEQIKVSKLLKIIIFELILGFAASL